MASREIDTMFMQNFGVTNKEYFGMLWHLYVYGTLTF